MALPRCRRCNGLYIIEEYYTGYNIVDFIRCVNCGDVIFKPFKKSNRPPNIYKYHKVFKEVNGTLREFHIRNYVF